MRGTLWEHGWLSATSCPSGRLDKAWETIEEEEMPTLDEFRKVIREELDSPSGDPGGPNTISSKDKVSIQTIIDQRLQSFFFNSMRGIFAGLTIDEVRKALAEFVKETNAG